MKKIVMLFLATMVLAGASFAQATTSTDNAMKSDAKTEAAPKKAKKAKKEKAPKAPIICVRANIVHSSLERIETLSIPNAIRLAQRQRIRTRAGIMPTKIIMMATTFTQGL